MSAIIANILTDEQRDEIRDSLNRVEDRMASTHIIFKPFLSQLPEEPIYRLQALFWCFDKTRKLNFLLESAYWFSGEGLIQFDDPKRNEELSKLFQQAFEIYEAQIQNTDESKQFIKEMFIQLQRAYDTHFTLQKFTECLVGDGTRPRDDLR
jgi:hypothetical protein